MIEETKEEVLPNNAIKRQLSETDEVFLLSQEMGLKAQEFIQNKNFITAKTLLMNACNNLFKLLKTDPTNQQIKNSLSQFLIKAEECQKSLAALYKINVKFNSIPFEKIHKPLFFNYIQKGKRSLLSSHKRNYFRW